MYLLDVSHAAVESGYLKLFADVLLDELEKVPGDTRTQIGFITYDSSVHFYKLADGLNQPHQLIVTDIDDIFLPCPNDLLVNLSENKKLVIELLEQLAQKFSNTPESDSALGAALQVRNSNCIQMIRLILFVRYLMNKNNHTVLLVSKYLWKSIEC